MKTTERYQIVTHGLRLLSEEDREQLLRQRDLPRAQVKNLGSKGATEMLWALGRFLNEADPLPAGEVDDG